MKIDILDKRHAGHTIFTHRVRIEVKDSSVHGAREAEFLKIREWCWEQFGPGCERDFAHLMPHGVLNEYRWAWYIDPNSSYKLYIYLKEETMTLFALKWGNT
jgi:hypothetical protein